MAQNSRIGKRYSGNRPSNIILPRTKSLSVQNIKKWKDALTLAQLAESPNRLPLLEIYESILIDSHLQSILESRILKILGSKFKFVNANGEENREINNLFKKKWFHQFLSHAMWSRFLGSSVVELWDLDEAGELKYTNLIPRENTLTDVGLIVKEVGEQTGYPYREGVFQNYYIQIGEDHDLGMLAKAAPDPLTKKYAKAAWAEYVEKYGIPPRVVTTDSYNDTRHQELADMLQSMVSNHWAVLQGGEKLEMMQTQGVDAYGTFDNLIKRMNSEMSKRFLGQDGTTDSKDTKGSYGSLKVMQEVADDRHDSDKTFLEYLINDELLWRLQMISPAYSALKDMRFEWDDTKELSPEELIKMVTEMSGAGYIVDPKYIEEKTSLPIIGQRNPNDPEPKPSGEKKKPKLNAEYRTEIRALYPKSTSISIEAAADPLQKDVLAWARDIYYNDDAPTVNWSLLDKTATYLLEALQNDKTKVKAAAGFEDGFYANLSSNLYVFSAAKTFTQYQEINELLTDDDGKPRSYTDFKDRVLQLHKNYNINYLKTEFTHAKRTAQMAGKWARFEKNKDLFDLQFNTAGDSKVRKAHEKLDGITRPVDDGFWNKHLPPLDFGCRCGIRQVAKGTSVTPKEKLKGLPKVPKQFQFNAGKQQIVYKNDHPYIKNLFSGAERELQAVKDYGLKRAEGIYAKGKGLIRPLKKLESKEAAVDWFTKKYGNEAAFSSNMFGKQVQISLSKDRMVSHILDKKPIEKRWQWINNISRMIENPHEVYILHYKEARSSKKLFTYRYITYFKDKIRVVNVDKNLKVQTAYEVDIKAANSERQGYLVYAKK